MQPKGDEHEWPNPTGPLSRPRVHVHALAAHSATPVQSPQPQPLLYGQPGAYDAHAQTQQSETPPSSAIALDHNRAFLHHTSQPSSYSYSGFSSSASSSSSSSSSSASLSHSDFQSMSSAHESHLGNADRTSTTYAPTSNRSSSYNGGSGNIQVDQDEEEGIQEGEGWNEHHYYDGAYSSGDDTDMSDGGGGAHLVNYLEIANILTRDMSSPTQSYFEAAAAEYDAVNREGDRLDSDHNDSDDDDGTFPGHEPEYAPQPPPHYQSQIPHTHYQFTENFSNSYATYYGVDADSEPETGIDADMEIDQDYDEDADSIHHALQTFNSLHAFNPPPAPDFHHPTPIGLPVPDIPVPDQNIPHEANPPIPSQNNTMTLRPFNQNLLLFLETWAQLGGPRSRTYGQTGHIPLPIDARRQLQDAPRTITYEDLRGDRCDLQGINWVGLGVTRREARERRLVTYTNYVNKIGSDKWHPHLPDLPITMKRDYFRLKRMDIRKNIHLAHFQLRNLLASPSRSQVFYSGNCKVLELNPLSGVNQVAMKSTELGIHISTLAADHGVLIAGGFSGEYCLKNLDAEYVDETPEAREGTITTHPSGITNHVQLRIPRSSSSPRAAFASNDGGFRVLDIATETFLSTSMFKEPLNCTAMSPDGRLRVMVGDECDVYITTAEKERKTDDKLDILHRLSGHRDYGFACDWAPDGYTVATGFQDKAVKIWDARRWKTTSGAPNPLCTIRCEVAGARGLKFSPLGSGKRVLVAAEEADYVNIIDAQTFKAKQTIDIFGEIGGIDFVGDGRELHVLCADQDRGGLIQLERCGIAEEMAHDENAPVSILGSTSHHRYAALDRGENEYPLRGGTFDWPAAPVPRIARREMEWQARKRRYAAATRGIAQF